MVILATNTLIEYLVVRSLKMNSAIVIGFIGAILGGLISGGFTFWGVRLTLDYEKNKNELLDLPNKIYNIEILIEKAEKVKELLRIMNIKHIEEVKVVLGDRKNLLNTAISINFEVYKMTKKYINLIDELEKRENPSLKPYLSSIFGNNFISLSQGTTTYYGFLKKELHNLENRIYGK